MPKTWLLVLPMLLSPMAERMRGQEAVRLLETQCSGCHNATVKQGGLDLSSREKALRGGDRGPAITPGKLDESLLYQYVTHARQPGMPMGGKKLSEEQIALLAEWIRAGAPFEKPLHSAPAAKARSTHWSFQRVERPATPRVKNQAWVRTPIDAFLAAEQEKHGLQPAREADRNTLLRRVFLDLTGMPPSPAQMRAFLADTSANAYEKQVDWLLASQQYGERWGRHWMDIWRYSDWYGSGAEIRNSQPHIWRWRDWIIESLNAGKGYDRMVHEMLAGDEIAPTDPATLRATGFLARNYFLFNRNVWMQDTVEATTGAFLGVTLKCARCHDHKYDPLAQEDYYRFRAFFEPHDVRLDRVAGEPDLKKAGLARVFEANPREDIQNAAGTFLSPAIFGETYLFIRGDERNPDKSHPLKPGTPPALGGGAGEPHPVELPLESFYPDYRRFVQEDLLADAKRKIAKVEAELAKTRETLAKARAALTAPPVPKAAGPRVDFEKEVKPLLETRCGACHLARNMKSGFSVASVKSIAAGGAKLGPAAIPGEGAASPLVQILRGEKKPRMPLNGPPMEEDQIALIGRWIDQLPPPDPAVVVNESEARIALGEKERATAIAALAGLEARIRAENAKYAAKPDSDTTEKLAAEARRAERQAAALQAQENVLRAQQRLNEALAAEKLDEGKVNAAKKALEQAVEALNSPKEGYSPLGAQYPKTSSGRRLALAQWITSRENPLAARVAVNHIWLRHFGKALVPSVTDFGKNGRAPTHPQLLDWLAAEFMESGWNMKAMHRIMVTSAAYRMESSAAAGAANAAADPENQWYWRMNPRRLEAEAIRDSVLQVSGELDPKMGGPELNEETDANVPRRSLYFHLTPDAQLQFLKVFDGVDPTNCFVRTESIMPQQALALVNSKLTMEHSRILAKKLAAEPDFVDSAFQHVLSRKPTAAELEKSRAFLTRQASLVHDEARARANLIHALFNRNEFVILR